MNLRHTIESVALSGLVLSCHTTELRAQLHIANTGQSETGARLGLGELDPHWRFVEGRVAEPAAGSGAQAITYFYPSGWIAPGDRAQWISTSSAATHPPDTFHTFFTTFDIVGVDPASVRLTGMWGVDDQAVFYLNGERLALSGGGNDLFRILTPMLVDSGFRSGTNVFAVEIYNSTPTSFNPSGLLMTDLSLTGAPTVVPEPSPRNLLAAGLLVALAGVRVSRRARRVPQPRAM